MKPGPLMMRATMLFGLAGAAVAMQQLPSLADPGARELVRVALDSSSARGRTDSRYDPRAVAAVTARPETPFVHSFPSEGAGAHVEVPR